MTLDSVHAEHLREWLEANTHPVPMAAIERSLELLDATANRVELGRRLAEHRELSVDADIARQFIEDSIALIRATNHHMAACMDSLADYDKALKANPLYEAARRACYTTTPKADS